MKKLLLETSFSKIYMIGMIVITLLVVGGYFSYAMFTVSKEKDNAISIVTGNLTYKLEVDGTEGNKLVVGAGETKEFTVTLSNPNNRTARFNFYYEGNLPNGVEAGYTVGASTPLAINSATKNADAAWRFVEFMTGEEGSAVYAKEGYIPARSDSTILDTVAANEGMPEGLAEALQTKNIVPDRPIADHVGDVDLVLGEQHSMIMLGEATIDDALADLTSQVKDIMEG